MKIINTQRISYSNSQFADGRAPRKAVAVDTRTDRERRLAAPDRYTQGLAAMNHLVAEALELGFVPAYQTGPRRGQQIAQARARKGR